MLNKMGAEVDGAGTDVIHIEGTRRARAVRSRDHRRPHRGRHVHGRGGGRPAATCCSRARRSTISRRVVVKLRQAGVEIEREGDARARAPRTGAARAGRRHHRAAPRLPDRHAGAVHGADVPRRGRARASPRRSSRTASCTCPSSAHGRAASTSTATPRIVHGVQALYGAQRDGDRSARQRLARHRRARRRGRDRACAASTTSIAATSTSSRSSPALGADIERLFADEARPRRRRRRRDQALSLRG